MFDANTSSSLIPLYRLLVLSTLSAVVGICAYFILPERSERILPDQSYNRYLFFDAQMNGKTTANWIQENELHFKCSVAADGIEWPYCGMRVMVGNPPHGKNYSKYQKLEIKLTYTGGNERLRMTLHNFNKAYSTGSFETLKGLDVQFLVEETSKPIIIHNYEWRTSEYWLRVNKIPRALTYGEFDNIVDFSVDLPPPVAKGDHYFKIEYVDLYGELLPPETWYLCVSLGWLLTNLILIVRHLFFQELRIRNDSNRLSSLSNNFDDMKQESQKYKHLSNIDQLTGALNRNGFAEEMNQSLSDGKLNSHVALILIDLDHFKKINDSHGHDAGDIVLSEVASTIRANVLGSDKLIRWGGEEFLLFCKDTNKEQASLVAERVRHAIENLEVRVNGCTIPVTISLGVATTNTAENFKDLFHRTDQALYEAKHSGRNRIVFAQSVESQ